MLLTTLDRVRTLLMGGTIDVGGADLSQSASDAILQLVISVSATVENYLDRVTESDILTTEYLDIYPLQMVWPLRAYPVASVTGVWFDTLQTFGDETALESTEYFSPVLGLDGHLRMRHALSEAELLPRSLKVTYTGGMAPSTEQFIDDFPDIASACDRQIIYEWKRRNDPGSLSISSEGGSVSVPAVHLLEGVRETLNRHRRWTHG